MTRPQFNDYAPAAIAKRQLKAERVASALLDVPKAQVLLDGLPPSLCQENVANFRRDFRQEFLDLHEPMTPHPQLTLWFVTVIHPSWVTSAGELSPGLLRDIREWAYRRLLKADQVRLFSGIIDFTWSIGTDVEGLFWQPHIHAVVAVSEMVEGQARKYLRRIFRTPKNRLLRIHRPLRVQEVTALEGALEYCSKALLIDGLVRRSSWISPTSGRRRSAAASLQRPQLLEIGRLMMTSTLDDRVIHLEEPPWN